MAKTPIQRLKELDRQIQEAKVEASVREKRLKTELRPRRTLLETQCQEQFGCTPQELPAKIEEMDRQIDSLLTTLEADVDAAALVASGDA